MSSSSPSSESSGTISSALKEALTDRNGQWDVHILALVVLTILVAGAVPVVLWTWVWATVNGKAIEVAGIGAAIGAISAGYASAITAAAAAVRLTVGKGVDPVTEGVSPDRSVTDLSSR